MKYVWPFIRSPEISSSQLRDSETGDDATIDWHDVASCIEGRNNKDCRKRWIYSLEPSINKGSWDREEDALLIQGVRLHGTRWALVSQVVGSRQPDQCARRWHESLKPNINHDRWSALEDETLKQAVDVYGRRWTEIVERHFPNRTPIAAKNRYTQRFLRTTNSPQATATHRVDEATSSPGDLITPVADEFDAHDMYFAYGNDFPQRVSHAPSSAMSFGGMQTGPPVNTQYIMDPSGRYVASTMTGSSWNGAQIGAQFQNPLPTQTADPSMDIVYRENSTQLTASAYYPLSKTNNQHHKHGDTTAYEDGYNSLQLDPLATAELDADFEMLACS
ncbi:MAG: hypothetical protein M1813_003737 [Trichoglossum hirsutum]|nr:MAG: hypothetical protein M1813_003737 [Trichoglossum hirsutum]